MLRYALDPIHKLGVVEYSGSLDHATMLSHMKAVWDDPSCDSQFAAICDFRDVRLDMSPVEVKDIFHQIAADPRSLKGRCALLISTPMETALGFIFKGMTQKEGMVQKVEMNTQIFYLWENACEFVGFTGSKDSLNWKTVD